MFSNRLRCIHCADLKRICLRGNKRTREPPPKRAKPEDTPAPPPSQPVTAPVTRARRGLLLLFLWFLLLTPSYSVERPTAGAPPVAGPSNAHSEDPERELSTFEYASRVVADSQNDIELSRAGIQGSLSMIKARLDTNLAELGYLLRERELLQTMLEEKLADLRLCRT
jgi:hypothetical protein